MMSDVHSCESCLGGTFRQDVSHPLSEVSSPNKSKDVHSEPTLRCGGQDIQKANVLSPMYEVAFALSDVCCQRCGC